MAESDSVPLCKDCRFARRDWSFAVMSLGFSRNQWIYAKCMHPAADMKKIRASSPIDGHGAGSDPNYCSIERDFDSRCGKSGKNWEPKA